MTTTDETYPPVDADVVRPAPPASAGERKKTAVAIAVDHGGFPLKAPLTQRLREAGYDVRDFGASELTPGDDYPDFVIPLARAVAKGEPPLGIAICGSGVGACISANKVAGARAGLCADTYSAHQGVEDDNMNILCIGARVTGPALAWELVQAFLAARFRSEERFRRRLRKVAALEGREGMP